MKTAVKKYGPLLTALLLHGAALLLAPRAEKEALSFCGQNLLNFFLVLPPVFLCVGLIDACVSRDRMMSALGENSGVKGAVFALAAGMAAAVPFYALLPVAGLLLKKGSRILNVLIFLGASASLRIPLLLFEISSLGLRFALARLGLNLCAVFATAFLTEKLLSEEDKRAVYEKTRDL